MGTGLLTHGPDWSPPLMANGLGTSSGVQCPQPLSLGQLSGGPLPDKKHDERGRERSREQPDLGHGGTSPQCRSRSHRRRRLRIRRRRERSRPRKGAAGVAHRRDCCSSRSPTPLHPAERMRGRSSSRSTTPRPLVSAQGAMSAPTPPPRLVPPPPAPRGQGPAAPGGLGAAALGDRGGVCPPRGCHSRHCHRAPELGSARRRGAVRW